MVRRAIDWLTLRRGDTSTAWRRTVPCEPIRVESSRGPVLTIASTRTYTDVFCQFLDPSDSFTATDLDGVLVAQEVDDLERVGNNTDGHELLSVVTALHHQTIRNAGSRLCDERLDIQSNSAWNTHLSTNRSTMGICAFLNCFLA